MNANWIITAFVFIETLMERFGYHRNKCAQAPASEVMLIAVVAAKSFHHHHERAVCILYQTRYVSEPLAVSRFNRRLHKLADWHTFLVITLGELLGQGDVFAIDSMPLPVCLRVRARCCRKGTGTGMYCG